MLICIILTQFSFCRHSKVSCENFVTYDSMERLGELKCGWQGGASREYKAARHSEG